MVKGALHCIHRNNCQNKPSKLARNKDKREIMTLAYKSNRMIPTRLRSCRTTNTNARNMIKIKSSSTKTMTNSTNNNRRDSKQPIAKVKDKE